MSINFCLYTSSWSDCHVNERGGGGIGSEENCNEVEGAVDVGLYNIHLL